MPIKAWVIHFGPVPSYPVDVILPPIICGMPADAHDFAYFAVLRLEFVHPFVGYYVPDVKWRCRVFVR
jgi:hypothetical protein